MTEERAMAILAAYGADPARWPADEREALRALVGAPALQAALAEARALDQALGRARAADYAAPSDALMARVLAGAPVRAGRTGLSPVTRSLAALAACAVFGLAVGFGAGQFAPPAADDAELEALVAEALSSGGDGWLSEGVDG